MIIFTRNLVAKDFWLKLFSLALASLIWLTVKFSISGETPVSPWLALLGRPPDEKVLTVPLRPPTGFTQFFSASPPTVQVTLHGDPKLLKALHEDAILAEVDLTGIESANGLMRPVEVILPKGVSYTHIEPEHVEVRVSRKTE